VRLPSATATVLTGILVFVAGRAAFDRRAGVIAAVAYYTAPYVHSGPNAGRTGAADPVFIFFGTLFVLAVAGAVVRNEDRWFYYGAMGGLERC
jgi:4-amino-4-deoxy-L-arabinose transferase-like glycosyltransferase